MMIRTIATVLSFACGAALAQTVQLITADEAKRPPAALDNTPRALTRGPAIKLSTPERVTGSFPFKVSFEPRGQSKIDVASVKVEYLRGDRIDLTDRIKQGIKASGIEVPAAMAPSGEHPIRITVRDSEGRLGAAEFKLIVK